MGADLTIPAHWYQRPRIVLLDAGMATHLSTQDQANMVGLFEAFSQLDGCGVADWTLRFSGGDLILPYTLYTQGFIDGAWHWLLRYRLLKMRQPWTKLVSQPEQIVWATSTLTVAKTHRPRQSGGWVRTVSSGFFATTCCRHS